MKEKNLAEGQLELAFFPLDVDYEDIDDELAIRLFGVTPEGKRVVIFDKNFAPYFIAVIGDQVNIDQLIEKLKALEIEKDGRKLKIQGVKIQEKKLISKKVKCAKITVTKPKDVPTIQAEIKKFPEIISREEFDISFYRRYLIDKGITPFTLCRAIGKTIKRPDLNVDIVLEADNISQLSSDVFSKPRILAFDIETQRRTLYPDPKEEPIIMLSLFGDGFQKVITWKNFSGAPEYVTFVDGELGLIEEFKKTINSYKPDIIVGYGSDSFDLPFLSERAKKYSIKLDLGIDGSEPEIRTAAGIKGIVHIDVLKFIRNILDVQVERLDLDAVGKALLGKGKLFKIDPNKINELWAIGLDEDLRNLVEYNLVDSQLAYELLLKLLPTFLQIVKLVGLPLFDISRMSYGQLVEWFLIKNAKMFNQIIPRKPSFRKMMERRKYTYEGALVIEPKPGLYKKIHVLDFRSLYPTIIASHNIDPATINCSCCKYKGGYHLEEKGLWFCSKERGFIPTLVQDIIERRRRITSILNKTDKTDSAYTELKARRYALKTIANSTYGYMGYAGSRWYCIDCARAITELGRKYIQEVIKEAQKFGFEVLYADTDSIFFLQGDKNEKDVMQFLKIINSVLPAPMELEYQDFYPAGIFLEKKGEAKGAKKRYVLLTRDGKIYLKGVEAIRGDWSKLAKDAQRKVLELILKEGRVESAVKYIQNLIKSVKERKIPLEDLIICVKLTKNLDKYISRGPHVVAAELAQSKGAVVGKGYEVKFIISQGKGKISDRVVLADDAKIEDYDPEYYIQHQIIRAVFKIFEIFGYTEEKLKAGQTTLSGFE